MLKSLTASRFDRRMKNGKTKPCLMACLAPDSDVEIDLVVKLSSGCERGVGGLVAEAIAAMFAADLELPVPEPFIVRIEPALVEMIPDAEIRLLCNQSSPVAFGSTLLPPSYSVWLHDQAIPRSLHQQATEIFAFDALTLNPDRRPSNPNCLCNGNSFAIYDHELSLLNTSLIPDPWSDHGLEFLRSDNARHLFQSSLQGTIVDLSRFAGAIDAVTPSRIQQYLDAIPTEWAIADSVAANAAKHLSDLRSNIEDAITEVSRILS